MCQDCTIFLISPKCATYATPFMVFSVTYYLRITQCCNLFAKNVAFCQVKPFMLYIVHITYLIFVRNM